MRVVEYPLVAAIADCVLTLLPAAPPLAMQPQLQPAAQLAAAAADASSQQREGMFLASQPDSKQQKYHTLAVWSRSLLC